MNDYLTWKPIIFDMDLFMDNHPSTRLPRHYKSRLLEKLKKSITKSQQHIFVISLYCYLYHYNSKTDCVVDFDHIGYCLGLETQEQCKELLKLFTQDIDYKITKNTNEDSQTILLTTDTFKKLYYKTESITPDELQNYSLNLIKFLEDENSESPEDLNFLRSRLGHELEYSVFTLLIVRK